MRRVLAAGLCLFLMVTYTRGQGRTDGILQLNDPEHTFLQRWYVLGALGGAHLTHQPLSAREAGLYLESIQDSAASKSLTSQDQWRLARMLGDTLHPATRKLNRLIPLFYRDSEHLMAFSGDGYGIQIDPLAYLSLGVADQSFQNHSRNTKTTWQNTRGLRVSGHVGPTVFFEIRVEENQAVIPDSARFNFSRRIGDTYLWDNEQLDYMLTTGVVGFRTRHFEGRIGRDRHRWGSALGSLYLSNYAPEYEFIQLRTTFGPIQYTNLYSAYQDVVTPWQEGDLSRPFKYGSMHRLAIDLGKGVQVGLTESVILAPTANERSAGYLMAFLNPVILYRAVDRELGSPGNILMALDASWRIRNGVLVYGTFLLDDFESAKIFSDPGYWKNTWGIGGGVQLADIPVDNLDLTVEYNRVRPYVYANRTAALSYTNQWGVLGHPMGANQHDLTVMASYRPTRLLALHGRLSGTVRGHDRDYLNYGGNPFKPYHVDRPVDSGVGIPHGVRQDVLLTELRASWEVLPSFVLEGLVRYESVKDELDGKFAYLNPMFTIRWGMPYQDLRY